MLEYAISQSSKTAACICGGVLKTVVNRNADFDIAQKIQSGSMICCKKGSGRPRISEETVECVRQKILLNPRKSSRRINL